MNHHKILKSHATGSVGESKKKDLPFCTQHRQPAEVYCENCDCSICWMCSIYGDHKGMRPYFSLFFVEFRPLGGFFSEKERPAIFSLRRRPRCLREKSDQTFALFPGIRQGSLAPLNKPGPALQTPNAEIYVERAVVSCKFSFFASAQSKN